MWPYLIHLFKISTFLCGYQHICLSSFSFFLRVITNETNNRISFKYLAITLEPCPTLYQSNIIVLINNVCIFCTSFMWPMVLKTLSSHKLHPLCYVSIVGDIGHDQSCSATGLQNNGQECPSLGCFTFSKFRYSETKTVGLGRGKRGLEKLACVCEVRCMKVRSDWYVRNRVPWVSVCDREWY